LQIADPSAIQLDDAAGGAPIVIIDLGETELKTRERPGEDKARPARFRAMRRRVVE
jgi:hypothetical protein